MRMIQTSTKPLIFLCLTSISCVSSPNTKGEANIRAGKVVINKMPFDPKQMNKPKKGRVTFKSKERKLLKIYVHPYAKGAIANDGHYIHVNISEGSWEAQ